MTDVWKSVPKKFCEICKCWFYDNKVSIQHHEQGLRHQENVKQKLRNLGKKGRQQEHEEREKRNALMQMERAAVSAYSRDLMNSSTTVAASYNARTNVSAFPTKASSQTAKRPRYDEIGASAGSSMSSWLEAKTTGDDGSEASYFWNIETGETSWQLPEGVTTYISLGDQKPPTPTAQPSSSSGSSSTERSTATHGVGQSKLQKTAGQKKSAAKSTAPKQKPAAGNKTSVVGGAVKDEPAKAEKDATLISGTGEPSALRRDTEYKKPFGDWRVVQVETKRKDEFTYLPHNRWAKEEASTAPVQDSRDGAVEEEPKEKITFAERTAPSVGSGVQSTTPCAFKKRKAPAEGR